MHEYALAEAVVDAALQTAEKERLVRITRIVVRVGELQQIERETFEFALKEMLPASEPRLASVTFAVETQPAVMRCRPCRREFGLADTAGPKGEDQSEAIHFVPELAHAFLTCPDCRSPDFELVEGRGVVLQRLEGDTA